MFEPMELTNDAVIKVIGVGGGGGNAVEHMVRERIEGVEFFAVNTDAQALRKTAVGQTIQIYAMPGLRLGYVLTADGETAGRLEDVLPPWNVSAPAQMAGCAALEEEAFVRESREFLLKEEKWMEEKLTELGFFVWPSDTIFCMFEGEEGLQEACLKRGIYIRDAASFPGIRKGTYRIGIRRHEDNVQLLEVLKTCGDIGKRREQWQKRS